MNASSYFPLPEKLKRKKAIINPKNEDQKCFLWCVAIHELLKENPDKKHPERITNELIRKADSFNTKGRNFPCEFSDINKFEKNNNNIAINVYGYEKKEKIFPLRISGKENRTVVDILLIENNGERHYCLIKNMSKLFSSQCSKRKRKIHICCRCLQKFGKEDIYKEHLEYCKQYECVKTVFPKKEKH